MSTHVETTGRVDRQILEETPHKLRENEESASEATVPAVQPACLSGEIPPMPHPLWHPLQTTGWLIQTGFGIATMILILAVVAAVPIANFLALGYLLEVQGRVARTGRFRDAFPLVGAAPRLGALIIGLVLCLLPVSLLAGAAADAQLIDPGSHQAVGWRRVTQFAAAMVSVHLCLAVARGGSLGCFVRPLCNLRWLRQQFRAGGYWQMAEANVLRYLASLRLWHHWSLGVRGFVGALAWLIVPTALFAAADRTEGGAFLVTVFGGLLLMFVLGWLPFLQARFAAENRLRAYFELRTIRELFNNAPLTWWLAAFIVYLLALPLYLTKVALLPRDAMWLITLVFIASIFPAKVLVGWAYHRATSRTARAGFCHRWLGRILLAPTLALYVFLLFFTQFIGEHGKGVLFEHHAFLLPVPF